jgi:hypothetical protein
VNFIMGNTLTVLRLMLPKMEARDDSSKKKMAQAEVP